MKLLSQSQASPIALIIIGAIVGVNLRYAVGAIAGEALLTTLLVNSLGSFLLGLLVYGIPDMSSEKLNYLFGIGFCASFTSYSTFIADILLVQPHLAAAYLLSSYTFGFAAVGVSLYVVGVTKQIRTSLRGDS